MQVYSAATGRVYPNEDAFVAAETNGYVVVASLSTGNTPYVRVFGPVDTKAEARRLADRVRYRAKRTDGVSLGMVSVTPLHLDPQKEDY